MVCEGIIFKSPSAVALEYVCVFFFFHFIELSRGKMCMTCWMNGTMCL